MGASSSRTRVLGLARRSWRALHADAVGRPGRRPRPPVPPAVDRWPGPGSSRAGAQYGTPILIPETVPTRRVQPGDGGRPGGIGSTARGRAAVSTSSPAADAGQQPAAGRGCPSGARAGRPAPSVASAGTGAACRPISVSRTAAVQHAEPVAAQPARQGQRQQARLAQFLPQGPVSGRRRPGSAGPGCAGGRLRCRARSAAEAAITRWVSPRLKSTQRASSLGRPSTRSATSDSRIWLVPPAMLRHLVSRNPSTASGRGAVGGGARPARTASARSRRPPAGAPPRPACAPPPRARPRRRCQLRQRRPQVHQRHGQAVGHRAPDLVRRAMGRQPARRRRPRSSSRSTSSPSAEPRPMATRSVASVLRATRQPSPGSPDDAVVGHEDLVEEDLVEHRPAGDLAQRADLDPGAVHVHQEVREPAGAWARPGRCGPGRSPSPPRRASEVHTFCPVSRQPPVGSATALVRSDGQVRARLRLAEQLAPGDLAAQRRPGEPLTLRLACRG